MVTKHLNDLYSVIAKISAFYIQGIDYMRLMDVNSSMHQLNVPVYACCMLLKFLLVNVSNSCQFVSVNFKLCTLVV